LSGRALLGFSVSVALLWVVSLPSLHAQELEGEGEAPSAEGWSPDPDAPRAARAHPIGNAGEMRVDGWLDEEAWAEAKPITEFVQREPVEGGRPSEPTEVRVLYDEDALYIGAILHDSDPDGIIAHKRRWDDGLGTDDRFMWILDTFHDRRTGYFFETNPAGLMGDGLITGGGGFGLNKSWDGIWDVRTQVTEEGWTVEVRIPFSTLNFDPALDTWGINFQRTIRRRNEEIVWSGWRQNQRLFRPVHAGVLQGLNDLSQGVGLEVKPFVTGNWANMPGAQGDPHDLASEIGGDLEYSVTPSLRAAVTVNTDFAEVEVDQRRVNLTRFPLFFPERRDFFLETAGVFQFAPRQGVNPFFTRRIGLVDGETIPLDFGTRIGGQAGPYELGFFQVRTGSGTPGGFEEVGPTIPGEDFTAFRLRRSILSESRVGVIYTRRSHRGDGGSEDRTEPPEGHTAGVDFDLFTSSFLGDYNVQFEGFWIWHSQLFDDSGTDFSDRRARGIRFDFPNDVWQFSASLREFGEAFEPAVGFQRRNGFRRFQPTLAYAPRPSSIDWLRQVEWQLRFEYLTRLDGLLLTRDWRLTFFDLEFESGDRFEVSANRNFERLENPFDIRDGITIPVGAFNTTEWSASFRTTGRRALSGAVEVRDGGFWTGDRFQFETEVTARPTSGVGVTTEYERNEVRLPEGDFDTNVLRLGADWDPTPLQSFRTTLQYDDVSRVLGLFARVRWILRPGNDLFLVYTHNWRNEAGGIFGGDLATANRGGAVKVNYTYRF